jgi:hypothetical protein
MILSGRGQGSDQPPKGGVITSAIPVITMPIRVITMPILVITMRRSG